MSSSGLPAFNRAPLAGRLCVWMPTDRESFVSLEAKTSDNVQMLRLIGFYRRWISPLLPPRCRFLPTCSAYAAEAIECHGLAHGGCLALKRICKCHPFHPGGFDPVPTDKLPVAPSRATSEEHHQTSPKRQNTLNQ